MKMILTDAGRSLSRRPKQKMDCVIRAIALAFGFDYDTVYDTMAGLGRKSGRGTAKAAWQPWLTAHATKLGFPAVKGQRRVTPPDFCRLHPRGRYVVQVAGHLFAVIDGVAYDDRNVRESACVYAAWQVTTFGA